MATALLGFSVLASLWAAAALTLINSVLLFFYFYLDDDELFGLIDLFDLLG